MKARKINTLDKLDIIFLNLAFAIPLVLFANLFFTITFQWTPFLNVDYLTATFGLSNGFFVLDNIKIGLHFIPNIILTLTVWFYMIYKTLKTLNQSFTDLFPVLKNRMILKITNLFL